MDYRHFTLGELRDFDDADLIRHHTDSVRVADYGHEDERDDACRQIELISEIADVRGLHIG